MATHEQDLHIKGTPEEIEKELADGAAEETEDDEDYIEESEGEFLEPYQTLMTIALAGLEFTNSQDEMLLGQKDKKRIQSMRKRSIEIADYVLEEVYVYVFGNDSNINTSK